MSPVYSRVVHENVDLFEKKNWHTLYADLCAASLNRIIFKDITSLGKLLSCIIYCLNATVINSLKCCQKKKKIIIIWTPYWT